MKRSRDNEDAGYDAEHPSSKRWSGSPTGQGRPASPRSYRDSAPASGGGDRDSGSGPASNNQVFVGSVSYDASEQDLREFFSDCGSVRDIRIPTYPDSGRPRGIAFIEFADDDGARRAIDKNGMELQGRALKISIAVSRGNRDSSRGGGDYGSSRSSAPAVPRGVRPEGCKTVFVGNLSWGTDERSLTHIFDRCGRVTSVRIVSDRDTGRSRGFGYVEFETEEAVEEALRLSGIDVDGRPIRVDYAADRSRGGGGGGGDRSNGYSDRGGSSSGYGDRSYSDRGGSSGYADRSSGYSDRGGYADRYSDRGGSSGYADRSSGYSDRGGYADHRSGGYSDRGGSDSRYAERSSGGYDRSSGYSDRGGYSSGYAAESSSRGGGSYRDSGRDHDSRDYPSRGGYESSRFDDRDRDRDRDRRY